MLKKLSKLLLIIGALPFISFIGTGIYNAINGFSLFPGEAITYGLNGFLKWFSVASATWSPAYVIGFILAIIAALKISKKCFKIVMTIIFIIIAIMLISFIGPLIFAPDAIASQLA